MTNHQLLDIVREYFPGASDDKAWYILWNETGYPCYWDGEPEPSLRKQLQALAQRVRAASVNGQEYIFGARTHLQD